MVIETYVKECGVETVIVCVWSLVVIQTYFKECGSGDCHCLFVVSSGHTDLYQGVWGGDCHCLFVVSSGHTDLYQGVWEWILSLFVSGLQWS